MKNKLDQVSIRLVKDREVLSNQPVDSPVAAVRLIASLLEDMDRELCGVINFRTDGIPINFSVCSMGSLNQSLVCPREFLKSAILSNAQGIMLFHNHPSGSLYPSKEDCDITKKFSACCELMGFSFLDHVIVAPDKDVYYSINNCRSIKFCAETSEYIESSVVLPLENNAKKKGGKTR